MSTNSFVVKKSLAFVAQSTPPSNAAKGDMYKDSNGDILQYSGTSWARVGTGSGGINYLSANSDFEGGVTGYSTYADVAAAFPADATGGSPNITFTATTSSPLRGTQSGLITKDAANRQGQGVSSPFTIDSADQSQALRISFDYSSSANYVDDDARVYVYDVTNSQLIEVVDRTISATTQGKFVGIFQASSNSTSYRLVWHVASANANAWTLKIDNVVVGPQTVIKGPIVTDWISWTPTGSWITNTTYTGKYRRDGDMAHYQVKIALAGAPTAGLLEVNLPTGHVIDSAKLVTPTTWAPLPNSVVDVNDSGAQYGGIVAYSTTSKVVIEISGAAATYVRNDNALSSSGTIPATLGAGDYVTIHFSAPIAGWSSNTLLSEDSGNRLVEFIGSKTSGAQSLTADVTNITIDTVIKDTTSSWSGTVFTVPETGYYTGYLTYNITSVIGGHTLFLYVNGVQDVPVIGRETITTYLSGTFKKYLTKGQTVSFRSNLTSANYSNFYLSISKDSSPQTVIGTYLTGATSPLNSVLNSNFETALTGYSTYADAAASSPVDGTGGSPSITFAQSSVAPLRGTYSGLLTKDAVNRQGEGLGYAFTIDSADKAQVLRISFDYETSTNYVDDDIRLYIYDVTNASLIEVIDRTLYATAGQGRFIGTFQSSSSSTSYRLIWHIASTNANAWTFKVDNVVVGPQTLIKGPVATDWQSYTPTVSNLGTGSLTTNTAKWRRVGDSMEIEIYNVKDGSGGTGALGVSWSLPSGYAVDINKLGSSGASYNLVGNILDAQSGFVGAIAYLPSTLGLYAYALGNGSGQWNGSSFTAGKTISIKAVVPITGWSSNVIFSEDSENRLITCQYTGNAGTAITNAVTDIPFTTSVYDTTASWNGTQFTAPETGYYSFKGSIQVTVAANLGLLSYVNGSLVRGLTTDTGTGTGVVRTFTGEQYLTKGQTLSIRANSSGTLSNNSANHWIAIHKISSPQTLANSEIVAARAIQTSGQSFSNNITTTVVWDSSKVYDTHNALNASTGVFTCPVSGYYDVKSYIVTAAVAWTQTTHQVDIYLYKNGVNYSRGFFPAWASVTNNFPAFISDTVYLSKGDTLEVKVGIVRGTSTTLYTSAPMNFVSIMKK